MEAFAQRIPPWNARELTGSYDVFKFLLEFMARVTSSAPSQLIKDHPSSLNPLTASLNPLQEDNKGKRSSKCSYSNHVKVKGKNA